MMPLDFNNVAILNIYGFDYRGIICGISKSEAIILLKNSDLSDFFTFAIIKMKQKHLL